VFKALLKPQHHEIQGTSLDAKIADSLHAKIVESNWIQEDIEDAIKWATFEDVSKELPSQDTVKDFNDMVNTDLDYLISSTEYMIRKPMFHFKPDHEWDGLQPDTRGKMQRIKQSISKKIKITDFGTLDSWQETLHQFFEINTFAGISKQDLSTILRISTKLLTEHMKITDDNRRKILNYNPETDGPIKGFIFDLESLNDAKLLSDIVGSKGKQQLHWYGFIYEWVDKWTGITMTGKTRAPHGIRKFMYVMATAIANSKNVYFFYANPHQNLEFNSLSILDYVLPLFDSDTTREVFNKIVDSGVTIYGLMFQHLNALGLIKYRESGVIDKTSLDFNAIFKAIDDRFEFKIKKLTFSETTLKKLEIDRIKVQQIKGVSINVDIKSLGPPALDYLLVSIIKFVSCGQSILQIVKSLKSLNYKTTVKDVTAIFNHNFGGFKRAQELFFFPLLRELKSEGFTDLQIGNIFSSELIKPHLNEINALFKRGFSVERIITKLALNSVPNVKGVIENALIIMNSEYHRPTESWWSFVNFRTEVLKAVIIGEVKHGVMSYGGLLTKLDGFRDTKQIKKFLHHNLKNFKNIFENMLSHEERARVTAVHLISGNINLHSGYDKFQLLDDLMEIFNLELATIDTQRLSEKAMLKIMFGIDYKDEFYIQREIDNLIHKVTGSSWEDMVRIVNAYKFNRLLPFISKNVRAKYIS